MSWERRYHPLLNEWVTITSHRNSRPWSGDSLVAVADEPRRYEPDCYLCPGNSRISGLVNDDYTSILVFDNDHPSFGVDAPVVLPPAPGFYRNAPANGVCRVVCYSPLHNASLSMLPVAGVNDVLSCWATQTRSLVGRSDIESVLVFENKGGVVGVSNPHPHCQIYATGFVFNTLAREAAAMQAYAGTGDGSLFTDIIDTEATDGQRIVAENEAAIAFVPYFARFPYEVYVAPRVTRQYLHDLTGDEMLGLSSVLSEVLVRLDNLWKMSFPYMLVLHQAPCDGGEYSSYHCHIQIHPPLRQPGLQKYLASVETGAGNFLNDTSPEEKAAELQSVSGVHYLHTH
ncbi:MAG: galactose-1-phosphate uridylyltransferase [Pseudomonadales bacterium]